MPTVRQHVNDRFVYEYFARFGIKVEADPKQTVEEKVRELWNRYLAYRKSKEPMPIPKNRRPYYRMNERW
jgi:hypothetical protein